MKPKKPSKGKPIKDLTTYTEPYFKGLPVNTTPDIPLFLEILEKNYDQLTKLMAHHSRVVLVRLDLRPPKALTVDMTKFTKSFVEKLEGLYGKPIAYVWVQEFGSGEYNSGLHYHIWVAAKQRNHKGNPMNQANDMDKKILKSWESQCGEYKGNYKSSFYELRRPDFSKARRKKQLDQVKGLTSVGVYLIPVNRLLTRKNNRDTVLGGVIDECFYGLSYLAKRNTKLRSESNRGKRVYSASNISIIQSKYTKKGRFEQITVSLKQINLDLSDRITPAKLDRDTEAYIELCNQMIRRIA